MTLTLVDRLKREQMILQDNSGRLKEMRDGISMREPGTDWLKHKLTYLIMELQIEMSLVDKELANAEADERIRRAKERKNGKEDEDHGRSVEGRNHGFEV